MSISWSSFQKQFVSRPVRTSIAPSRSAAIALVAVIFLIVLRFVPYLATPSPLDADECAELLMAMDLSQSPRLVAGWYGQDYMGPLEMYVLALTGPIFGWSTRFVRVNQLVLTLLCFGLTLAALRRQAGQLPMVVGAFFLAAGAPFTYGFMLRARGYGVMQVLVALLLFLWFGKKRLDRTAGRQAWTEAFALGLTFGVSVWANELTLMFFPLLASLVWTRIGIRMSAIGTGVGLVLGIMPRIINSVKGNFEWAKYLAGSLLQVSRSDFQQRGVMAIFGALHSSGRAHEKWLAVLGGAGWPLVVVGVASCIALIVVIVHRRRFVRLDSLGIGMTLLAGFAVASRPRYVAVFFPLAAVAVALVARALHEIGVRYRLLLAILALMMLLAVLQSADHGPYPVITPVAEFVQAKGYTRGIGGYSVAYPLTVAAHENVVVSTLAGPIFTSRFRKKELVLAKEGAQFVVFALGGKGAGYKGPECLENYLNESKYCYRCDTLSGAFVIYHAFDRPLYPGDGLCPDDRQHFERHRPTNPRKIMQERANELLGAIP